MFPVLKESEHFESPFSFSDKFPFWYRGRNPFEEKAGELFISTLTDSRIIEAYSHGVFPYYDSNDLIEFSESQPPTEILDKLVFCFPAERYILRPEVILDKVQKNRSLRKSISKFDVIQNSDFEQVLKGCHDMKRLEFDENGDLQDYGTWIKDEFIQTYLSLHKQGITHSFGAYREDKLAGGLFGVEMNNYFSGDSMFRNIKQYGDSFCANASKAALVGLARKMAEQNKIIDCQYHSDFFESMGGEFISAKEFYKLIRN